MEFKTEDFLPVILGGDITAYSLARSFHEEYGIRSLVVSQISSHMCADSSIIDNVIVPGMENLDVFLPTLARIADEHPDTKLILMACGDWYVRLIVENRAELERRYILPYISEDLLNRLVLKDSFYRLCDEGGGHPLSSHRLLPRRGRSGRARAALRLPRRGKARVIGRLPLRAVPR